jgi:hypothetical protein
MATGSVPRVAGEREGPAAAAAKSCSRADARAGLLHQAVPRNALNAGAFAQIGERMFAHVPELEAGNRFGGMAGQHLATGVTLSERRLAADARFGIARVVIRDHRVNDDVAVVTRAQFSTGRGPSTCPGSNSMARFFVAHP